MNKCFINNKNNKNISLTEFEKMDRKNGEKLSQSDGTEWYSIIDKKKYYAPKEALAISGVGESVLVMAKYQGHLKTKPGRRKRSWMVLGSDLILWDRTREKNKSNAVISPQNELKDKNIIKPTIKEEINPDRWDSIIDLNRYYSNKELPKITGISETRLFQAKFKGELKSEPGTRKRSWLVLGSDLVSWYYSSEICNKSLVKIIDDVDEVGPSSELSVLFPIEDYDKIIEDVHDLSVINERKENGTIFLSEVNITNKEVLDSDKIKVKTSIRRDLSKITLDPCSTILKLISSINKNKIISEGLKIGDTKSYYRVKKEDYNIIFEISDANSDFIVIYIRKGIDSFFKDSYTH